MWQGFSKPNEISRTLGSFCAGCGDYQHDAGSLARNNIFGFCLLVIKWPRFRYKIVCLSYLIKYLHPNSNNANSYLTFLYELNIFNIHEKEGRGVAKYFYWGRVMRKVEKMKFYVHRHQI